jgi:hypothetical protein
MLAVDALSFVKGKNNKLISKIVLLLNKIGGGWKQDRTGKTRIFLVFLCHPIKCVITTSLSFTAILSFDSTNLRKRR